MGSIKVSTVSPFDINRVRQVSEAVAKHESPASAVSPCEACSVRHLTFCAPLDREELAEVSKIVSNLELNPGDPLFDEGEEADYVYSVTAGALKVYKLLPDGRRQVTGFLFGGDFLGLASGDTYAYSAEAMSYCGMASNELVAAQEQMLLLGRKTAKEKIASFLMMLSERQVARGQKPDPVGIPMSRTDIGDYLGLTTETVSRTFTQFKTSHLISLQPGNKVQLSNQEKLESIAEGG